MISSRAFSQLLSAALLLQSAACAMNVSEARPARILRGGEWQISEANNIVVPTGVIAEAVDKGETVVKLIDEGRPATDEEKALLVGSAVSMALQSPGYGAHLDLAVGLGYGADLQLRIGNGIYAASMRYGLHSGPWHMTVGARAAYNSGESFIPYIEKLSRYAKIAGMQRFDGQLFAQFGIEAGEWMRLWVGPKLLYSRYGAEIDAAELGLGKESFAGDLLSYGGFIGAAGGFRVFFVVVELTLLRVEPETLTLFGNPHTLGGWVVAPTWGFQVVF